MQGVVGNRAKPRPNWRICLALAGLLVFLLSEFLTPLKAQEQEKTVIAIGMQPLWTPSAGILQVMVRDGILKKRLAPLNLEIALKGMANGIEVNKSLLDGTTQVGVGGDMPTLLACIGQSVEVMSLIDVSFTSIVASRRIIPTDLKGKRVAYTPGTNGHFGLLRVLSASGVVLDDLELVIMEVKEMPTALATGRIDAFTAWEIIPTLAISRYPNFQRISRTTTTGYLYMNAAFVKKMPRAAKEILAAQVRAMLWMVTDQSHLLKAAGWAKDFGAGHSKLMAEIDEGDIFDLMNFELRPFSGSPQIPRAFYEEGGKLAKAMHFLQSIGQIPETESWQNTRQCFDTLHMREVLADSIRYQLSEFNVLEVDSE